MRKQNKSHSITEASQYAQTEGEIDRFGKYIDIYTFSKPHPKRACNSSQKGRRTPSMVARGIHFSCIDIEEEEMF